jgi:hypothetical protein
MIYVLTLRTWGGFDPKAYHTYGQIHWDQPAPCDHDHTSSDGRGATFCVVCGADHSGAGFRSADVVRRQHEHPIRRRR